MLETVRPDVVIFDHSPTALWCSRGLPMRRVVIGSGFCVPPDVDPLPDLRPWQPPDPQRILNCERVVVAKINNILARWSCTPIDRLGQLFSEVDDTFLLTFKELDHYPNRPAETRYRGAWIRSEGAAPQRPSSAGKRVYGYLKPFPGLPALLDNLKSRGLPTLLFMERPDEVLVRDFSSATLRFEPRPLDLAAVARTCDLAIVHGTHGTTVTFLLAGKPTLQLPLLLEQGIFAGAVTRLGAALQPPVEQTNHITADLERLLSEPAFGDAARRFADRYVG
ncbi:MAG TPA: nucleotide disphospho-sugar-binding domain-containing protein, partial [Tepidisphaeraceae bacterium]|nr:nucleotide disphospho-sugar-binding domain-containing protein [Tepidisphaeraceae bacterium]